jgi:hypothetical protein
VKHSFSFGVCDYCALFLESIDPLSGACPVKCLVCGADQMLEEAHLVSRVELRMLELPRDAKNIRVLCRECHVTFDKSAGVMLGGLSGPWLARYDRFADEFARLHALRRALLDQASV